jgi:hypothetical protein
LCTLCCTLNGEMRTSPAYSALGFSKRHATALINGVFFL